MGTSSGNDSLISSWVREKIRTCRSPQCTCARMPSYLSSICASLKYEIASSLVFTSAANMKPIGWKSRMRASSSLPSAARRRVSPMSPSSMLARRTATSDCSYAAAIASSTKLSRIPMRRSPTKILMAYFASSAEHCFRSAITCSSFAEGPRAVAMSSNSFAKSGSVRTEPEKSPGQSS